MKKLKIVILVALAVFVLSPATFAMGGPPKEEPSQAPKVEAPAAAAVTAEPVKASSEELNGATAEIIRLESKLDRLEDYLDLLSKKILKARKSGNAGKVIELKSREGEAASQAKNLKEKIAKIREKYPELKELKEQPAKEKPAVEAAVPSHETHPRAVTPNIVYHEVVMGDSLIAISRKYFNTPDFYKEIAEMNGLTDTGGLQQGMILKIDLDWARKEAPKQPSAAKTAAAGNIIYHKVAAGETLMSISRKYFGTPSLFREIAAMNGITEPGLLKAGMQLKIDKSLKPKTERGF